MSEDVFHGCNSLLSFAMLDNSLIILHACLCSFGLRSTTGLWRKCERMCVLPRSHYFREIFIKVPVIEANTQALTSLKPFYIGTLQ